jgi:hypothetical protein
VSWAGLAGPSQSLPTFQPASALAEEWNVYFFPIGSVAPLSAQRQSCSLKGLACSQLGAWLVLNLMGQLLPSAKASGRAALAPSRKEHSQARGLGSSLVTGQLFHFVGLDAVKGLINVPSALPESCRLIGSSLLGAWPSPLPVLELACGLQFAFLHYWGWSHF